MEKVGSNFGKEQYYKNLLTQKENGFVFPPFNKMVIKKETPSFLLYGKPILKDINLNDEIIDIYYSIDKKELYLHVKESN